LITIVRKGFYAPETVIADGSDAIINLPNGDSGYPLISGQKPAPDSAAFPANRTIWFSVLAKDVLSSISVSVNDILQNASTTQMENYNYSVSFLQKVEADREYSVRVIASDIKNRTSVAKWTFRGEIPSQAVLGKDRFKYLGWWARVTSNGVNVRKEPSADSQKIGVLSSANNVKVTKEVFGQSLPDSNNEFENNLWYQIDGGAYPQGFIFSEYASPIAQPQPPEKPQRPAQVIVGDNWIDVDIAKKVMTLFSYDNTPLFVTYISPGRKENPTKLGTYNVWYKLKKANMSGGPPLHSYSYNLKNIPWVMYYNRDYAIHGTYWHDKFGTQQSAGCTNMTQGDAKFIFDNTKPIIPKDLQGIRTDEPSQGTVVYNHD
jgi:lipoprotein-anchoring transpeptidase ErfK/SrfK